MNMKQYILRTVKKDGTSWGGFQWNLEIGGETVAPDWNPRPECGGGLHGFLNGAGDGSIADWSDDALWLVVSTEDDVVDLGGKIKFERAITEYVGSLGGAVEFLADLGINHAVIGATVAAGDCGRATVGDYGTATAGDRGRATAGDRGRATVGDYGRATAGYYGAATVGYYGAATAGDYGAATAGDYGRATAGYYGAATAGYYGAATAGDYGAATVGEDGTATAGHYGTATAGEDGVIIINWSDDGKRRVAVGYIGEDGLKAGVAYRVSNGEFVEA